MSRTEDAAQGFAAAPTKIIGAASAAPASPGPHGMALPIGTRLEEFELLSVLGVGGFGIVYLAQDHSLGRQVALKEFMPTSLAWRDGSSQVRVRSEADTSTFELGMRSFVNEARLLARFDHRSLLKVYRFWQAHGTAYMVTPFYQGQTLAQARVAGSPHAAPAKLPGLMASIVGALAVLHGENVFHRDVAPDNIFLLEDGHPVLLDFGAARAVIGERTQSLTAILKPSFAPVEQYSQTGVLRQGPWTDFYALGGVMVYALTGYPPSPSVSRAIADDLLPLSEQTENAQKWALPPHFLRAVDWCLRIRPQDRPQAVDALLAVLAGEAGVPPEASTSQFVIRPANEMGTAVNAPTVPLAAAAVSALAQGSFVSGTASPSSAPGAAPATGTTSPFDESQFAATVLADDLPQTQQAFAPDSSEANGGSGTSVRGNAGFGRLMRWQLWAGVGGTALVAGWLTMGIIRNDAGSGPSLEGTHTPAMPGPSTVASASVAESAAIAMAPGGGSVAPSEASRPSAQTVLPASGASSPALLSGAPSQGGTGRLQAETASRPLAASAAAALRAAASRVQAVRAAAAHPSSPQTSASGLASVGATVPSSAAASSGASSGAVAAARATSKLPPAAAKDDSPKPAAPVDPEAACADRILLGKQLCLSRICRQPSYEKHPDCIKLRDIEDARLQPMR